MRWTYLLTGLVLAAGLMHGPAMAQTVTAVSQLPQAHQALPVYAVGRVAREATGYRHQWPGVYFEAAFDGDAAYLGFDDPWNEYRLSVDDRPPVTIAQPGKGWLKLADIGAGKHRLRLEKVTESIDHVAAFTGFYIAGEARAEKAPHAQARRIEFIGDSGMTGYGVRSTTTTCTPEEVRLRSDTQQAWPVLTAKHFGADYQVNAISGRGMVRNYDGTTPGFGMSDVYPFTFFDKTVPVTGQVTGKDWQPQIVMVALGGNDFSGSLKPAETQKVAEAYFAAYGRFVADLHRRYPKAAIVLQWPGAIAEPEYRQAFNVGRKSIETAAERVGLKRLVFMSPPEGFAVELGGCDYHASLAGHRKVAEWSIGWLEAHSELWR